MRPSLPLRVKIRYAHALRKPMTPRSLFADGGRQAGFGVGMTAMHTLFNAARIDPAPVDATGWCALPSSDRAPAPSEFIHVATDLD